MDSSDLTQLKAKILSTKLTRLAPLKVIDTDAANLKITFAVPVSTAAEHFFGDEQMALRAITHDDGAGADILIDDDRSKILGTFCEAQMAAGGINVIVKFATQALFEEAQSTKYTRCALHYKPIRIKHTGGKTFAMMTINVAGLSLCTEMYAPKESAPETLFDF